MAYAQGGENIAVWERFISQDTAIITASERAKQLAERVKMLMAGSGWRVTAYRLHKETGLSERICEDILNGKPADRQRRTLEKLASVFQVSVPELFDPEPFVEQVRIELTIAELDTLRAVAAIRNVDVTSLLRTAIERFVSGLMELPGVGDVVEAIERARDGASGAGASGNRGR